MKRVSWRGRLLADIAGPRTPHARSRQEQGSAGDDRDDSSGVEFAEVVLTIALAADPGGSATEAVQRQLVNLFFGRLYYCLQTGWTYADGTGIPVSPTQRRATATS